MEDKNKTLKESYSKDKKAFVARSLKTFENVLTRGKDVMDAKDYDHFKTRMVQLIKDN